MDKTETTNKTAENITYGTKTADSTSKTFNLGGQHSVIGTYGWICPICGRGNSPFTSTCPCKPWVPNVDITCNPSYKTVWTTTTTGGTINEAR